MAKSSATCHKLCFTLAVCIFTINLFPLKEDRTVVLVLSVPKPLERFCKLGCGFDDFQMKTPSFTWYKNNFQPSQLSHRYMGVSVHDVVNLTPQRLHKSFGWQWNTGFLSGRVFKQPYIKRVSRNCFPRVTKRHDSSLT